MTMTTFEYNGPSGVEIINHHRDYSEPTRRKRAMDMLGEREGCVAVYVDHDMTESLVRDEVGDTPYFETIKI
ncbi:MAG: hypothetical protein GVY36_18820 [Verrucomicrobia bacterium]|jgi:hypothetical protein|nr:hypothetical protein [Verrucomicrobiota bacterium]